MSPRRTAVTPPPELPALRYVGTARYRGVPSRDLSEHDLSRIAYKRAIASEGASGKRPDPRDPDPSVINEIMAELTGSGLYVPEEADRG